MCATEAQQLRAARELSEMRALVADLSDQDWQMRLKAAGKLPKQRKTAEMVDESVPALIKAVEDSNEFVRRTAVPALGDIGPQAKLAVPVLTELLEHPDREMRRSAAYALGKIGNASVGAVDPLITLLEDGDPEVRKAVSWALGIIGPEAVPPLTTSLSHENSNVRAGCAFALGNIGPNAIDAIDRLIACLNDPDIEVRYNSAKAIGNLRAAKEAEKGVGALILLLKDSDPDVRWVAAEALRKIGTKEAMEAWKNYEAAPVTQDIVKQLFNEDKSIRIDAAENLLKVITPNDEQLVGEIEKALSDQIWKVRLMVAESFAKIGTHAASSAKALKKLLNDENELVRAAAAHALGKIGLQAEIAVVRLVKKLKDEHKDVRLAAGLALEEIGTPDAVRALKKFKWE